jgi:hypothetical protein
MSSNTSTATGFRRRYWPPGLYEDENGYRFDGQIDAKTFSRATVSLGRKSAPALLFDLYYGKSLDLAAHPSVVADAWSSPEYPERCFEPDRWIWVKLFRTAGYTHDGQPATPPTEPITVYRGCTPEGRGGMAWTSDLAMARRFAHDRLRGRPVGQVYAFDAPPEALLAYIHETGRQESEYVIDNAFLEDAVRLHEQ